jgi:hypothetical protein
MNIGPCGYVGQGFSSAAQVHERAVALPNRKFESLVQGIVKYEPGGSFVDYKVGATNNYDVITPLSTRSSGRHVTSIHAG